jgi:hypothetical protein
MGAAIRGRPLPVFPAREDRNEQRINIIPARSAACQEN